MTQRHLGYADPLYAQSLREFGKPRELPRCGGWLLEREIPGTPYRDAMGCYSLFACRDWSRISEDLAEIGDDLVSVALVADPLGDYAPEQLAEWFDVAIPFKEHYVSDLARPLESFVSKDHRRDARAALKRVSVQVVADLPSFVDEWTDLYSNLIARHDIRGIRAFSRAAFADQFRIPGMTAFRADANGQLVGGHLALVQGDCAYYHLAAMTAEGYKLGAGYALKWTDLCHFAGNVAIYNHLGGAGVSSQAGDGLSLFKRGWSSGTRMAYFCGRILNRPVYDELAARSIDPTGSYFPIYRQGEFC